MQDNFMQRARPYLQAVSRMTAEAAGSDNPEVVALALSLVELQPGKSRELLREAQSKPDGAIRTAGRAPSSAVTWSASCGARGFRGTRLQGSWTRAQVRYGGPLSARNAPCQKHSPGPSCNPRRKRKQFRRRRARSRRPFRNHLFLASSKIDR